jgi:hypothetical protein
VRLVHAARSAKDLARECESSEQITDLWVAAVRGVRGHAGTIT